ncbi:tryparedoxin-like protein [Angomonas deanei]|uniref:Uncharacterized protein n=1 Tax=Angomonas deanei TaxID=59799 RepID=A0A7G2CHQ7_9TRYP|nr:tryparedoxin-like protein [Angomonas deanei]CAD2218501.1 hypothetical protein, conserved [Angomonas deanei]|eukprot:EPY27028.1 tryparedoxin-like protein [Angomonas deanei]
MMNYFQNKSSNYVVRDKNKNKNINNNIINNTISIPSSNHTSNHNNNSSTLKPVNQHHNNNQNNNNFEISAEAIEIPISSKRRSSIEYVRQEQSPSVPKTPLCDGHAAWLAIPFHEKQMIKYLRKKFKVDTLPQIVVLEVDSFYSNQNNSENNKNNNVFVKMITREGKTLINRDEKARHFPWREHDEEVYRLLMKYSARFFNKNNNNGNRRRGRWRRSVYGKVFDFPTTTILLIVIISIVLLALGYYFMFYKKSVGGRLTTY